MIMYEFCNLCNFILICPFYAELRKQYIKTFYYKKPSVLKLLLNYFYVLFLTYCIRVDFQIMVMFCIRVDFRLNIREFLYTS